MTGKLIRSTGREFHELLEMFGDWIQLGLKPRNLLSKCEIAEPRINDTNAPKLCLFEV